MSRRAVQVLDDLLPLLLVAAACVWILPTDRVAFAFAIVVAWSSRGLPSAILNHRNRAAAREAEVEAVAQAIAYCYGHGPLARMDQTYRDEFRRDARAAIAAMRRR